MSEIKVAKPRVETAEGDKWDLTKIYASDVVYQAAFEKFPDSLATFSDFKGTLSQGKLQINKALEKLVELSRELEKIYVYAHLKHDQDTSNSIYLEMNSNASALLAKVSEQMSWFEPEILALSEDILEELADDELYGHYFEELLAKKEHILSPSEEALLAGAQEIFSASSDTFSLLNNADLKFGKVKTDTGQKIDLTHGTYGILLESSNREVRKNAFKQLYATYEGVKNTSASTMSANIKGHNYLAKVRGYKSARERALDNNHIPESVYDTLLETVHSNIGLLHDYVALRKNILELDNLEMYDMYTPLAGNTPIKYTFEEAKEVTFKALAPLGKQYINDLHQAFDERWIDIYENIGKRSGAYSSGGYDTNPYILLNWQDSLNDLYTLVHELGHSMHSYYTRKKQPYIYGDYSIFLAEIASTTNENLLTEYLLNTIEDKEARIYILNHYLDGVKGTVFRQSQFAEFEHFMHVSESNGQALSADFLTKKYDELNKKYYGNAVGDDKTIGYEWSRIPHFYMNYYVYQYATGFSAANTLANRIVNGEEGAVEHYLAYLSAGSSDYPIEVMKKAGIDMTNATYIEETMTQFKERFEEYRQLMEK